MGLFGSIDREEESSLTPGDHDWHHATPLAGLTCRHCKLAHKYWAGEPCPETEEYDMALFGNISKDEEPDLTPEERAQAEQVVRDVQMMEQGYQDVMNNNEEQK